MRFLISVELPGARDRIHGEGKTLPLAIKDLNERLITERQILDSANEGIEQAFDNIRKVCS